MTMLRITTRIRDRKRKVSMRKSSREKRLNKKGIFMKISMNINESISINLNFLSCY